MVYSTKDPNPQKIVLFKYCKERSLSKIILTKKMLIQLSVILFGVFLILIRKVQITYVFYFTIKESFSKQMISFQKRG